MIECGVSRFCFPQGEKEMKAKQTSQDGGPHCWIFCGTPKGERPISRAPYQLLRRLRISWVAGARGVTPVLPPGGEWTYERHGAVFWVLGPQNQWRPPSGVKGVLFQKWLAASKRQPKGDPFRRLPGTCGQHLRLRSMGSLGQLHGAAKPGGGVVRRM